MGLFFPFLFGPQLLPEGGELLDLLGDPLFLGVGGEVDDLGLGSGLGLLGLRLVLAVLAVLAAGVVVPLEGLAGLLVLLAVLLVLLLLQVVVIKRFKLVEDHTFGGRLRQPNLRTLPKVFFGRSSLKVLTCSWHK